MTQSQGGLVAVNVALVPPELVQERARAINALLYAERPEGFRFDATHVPHISLVQQFVRKEQLPALIEQLNSLLRATRPLSLRALRAVSHEGTASLLVERTPDLHSLHIRLMEAAEPYEEAEGTKDAFYCGTDPAREEPRKEDVSWVATYRMEASYGSFIPHMTLGVGSAPPPVEPFEFTADRVGLFHLGRLCTCRLLLHEWTLLPL